MKKLLYEGIGTFFLVLTIASTGNPVAIGSLLAALVYMGASVSGGQYNPAVSLALWKIGKITRDEFFKYAAAQMLGAMVATVVYSFLQKGTFIVQPDTSVTFIHALAAESLFTFLLVLVVLQTAVSQKTQGNSYFGIAIGFTVLAGVVAVGKLSGGAFNPAVGVGPLLVNIASGSVELPSLALYILGPCIGAMAATWLYKLEER